MKLSAKWLNKFHINVIVVFPENIHTPSTEGNGNLIECWGGGGGGLKGKNFPGGGGGGGGRCSKGNNFRGVEWIQVFSGGCSCNWQLLYC